MPRNLHNHIPILTLAEPGATLFRKLEEGDETECLICGARIVYIAALSNRRAHWRAQQKLSFAQRPAWIR